MAGFFQRLRQASSYVLRGAQPSKVYTDNYLVGINEPMLEPPQDITPLGEIERDNPTIYRIADTISTDCASMELELVERSEDRKKHTVVPDHDAIVPFKRPNEVESGYIFMQTLYSDLLIYGNHYSYVGLTGNKPTLLMRIPPDQMKVKPDPKELVKGYIWKNPNGKEVFYDKRQILHPRTKNLQTPYLGMSPLERLRAHIVLERTMMKWNYNRFLNSVPTNMIMQSEATVAGGEERKEQLRQYVKRKMSGPEHAGEPLILDGERWKVDILPRAGEDEVAYLGGMKWIRGVYAMTYGTPPSEIGDWSDSFRSNSREQTRDYIAEVIGAWHRLLLSYLNDVYLPRYFPKEKNLLFRYNYSDVPALTFAQYEKAQVNEILVRNATIQPEEARASMGYDDSGDPAMKKFYWNGKELGKKETPPQLMPGQAPPEKDEEAEPDQPKEDDSNVDNQKKSTIVPLRRQLNEEEIYLLLDDEIYDEEELERKGRSKFRPVITVLTLGAAINWLRQHGKKDDYKRTDDFDLFIENNTARFIRNINDTTIVQIQDLIRTANSEGWSIRQVKQQLDQIFAGRRSNFELDRIARTETHQASEAGGFFAAIGDRDVQKLRWITARDNVVRGPQTKETRADHQDMEGQVIAKGGKFRDPVSNALLRFPGDSEGAVSGADVINCRCSFVAEMDEFIDRDGFWYQRNIYKKSNEKVVKQAAREHFAYFQAHVLERLEAKLRRQA